MVTAFDLEAGKLDLLLFYVVGGDNAVKVLNLLSLKCHACPHVIEVVLIILRSLAQLLELLLSRGGLDLVSI